MSVRRQCELLGMNRSSVYYRPKTPDEEARERKEKIMARIDWWSTQNPTWGARKICQLLRMEGYLVSRKTVSKYMGEMGIYPIYPKANLSKRNFKEAIVPYLLRSFEAHFPNQAWSVDITYDVLNSFYDGAALISEVLDAAKKGMPQNKLRRGLTAEEATAAYEEAEELSSGVISETKKAINELYADIDRINANDTLTNAEKYTCTSEKRREMLALTLKAQEAIGAYKEKYITGMNVATNMLYAGTIAHIPTAYEKLPQTFRDDEGEEYMQWAKSVYDATGKTSALPHPSTTFSSNGIEYNVDDEHADGFLKEYKTAYKLYLKQNGKQWAVLSSEDKLEILKKAHEKARDKAKAWYLDQPGVKKKK